MNVLAIALGGWFLMAQVEVLDRPYADFDVVVKELASHGAWHPSGVGRYVFQPGPVPEGWVPYREGQWIYTDFGWTWMGRDAGSWATCHYGHWRPAANGFWQWVPGVDWLASRVEWVRSGNHIGWRPAHLDRFSNLVEESDTGVHRDPVRAGWSFVPIEKMRGPLKAEDYARPEETARLLAKAGPIDHIYVSHWEIPRPGPSPDVLKTGTGQKPPILQIRNWPAPKPSEAGSEFFMAYRPRFHQDKDGIFRRVDLILNPRPEQAVQLPAQTPSPEDARARARVEEMERLRKKHLEDLYR